ncbi:UNVERIFIED_CONTAM: hypothetical protein Sindi_1426600 [Sesamum indicum]
MSSWPTQPYPGWANECTSGRPILVGSVLAPADTCRLPHSGVRCGGGDQQYTGPMRLWDAPSPPPPPRPLLPPVARRRFMSLQGARLDRDFNMTISNAVKEHYPHPWSNISQIPQEH